MCHKRFNLFLVLLFTAVASIHGSARGEYAYVLTVGKDAKKYNHTSIGEAVSAMKQNNPNVNRRGVIRVYTGIYSECIGGKLYGDDTKWLPTYCDLVGMGTKIDDVTIQHPSGTGVNAFTVIGAGNNQISHLKIYTNLGARNGIYLFDHSGLTDCIVDTIHISVEGAENLTVSNCTIKSMFGSCIRAGENLSVFNCTLIPRGRSWSMETPMGIWAWGSATIDNVTISSTVTSSYWHEGAGLVGIMVKAGIGKVVTISNTNIDLQLTSKFNAKETGALRVCGVMNGSEWFEPRNSYQARTTIIDSHINVRGIEGSLDARGDGAGIMVDGVCVRGGGTIEILGKTIIETSRTTARHAQDGYEHPLHNENGELVVEYDEVKVERNKESGNITEHFLAKQRRLEREEKHRHLFSRTKGKVRNYDERFTSDSLHTRMRDAQIQMTSRMPLQQRWSDENVKENVSAEESMAESAMESAESSYTIEISSDVTNNQIWHKENTYLVKEMTEIKALLVIEPGTTVLYDPNGWLVVNDGGCLISQGQPDALIQHIPSDWQQIFGGIWVEETASPLTQISFNLIEQAFAGIVVENNTLNRPIESNYVHGCGYGIVGIGPRQTPIINNQIYGTGYWGVEIYLGDSFQTDPTDPNSISDPNFVGDTNDTSRIASIAHNTMLYNYNAILVHGITTGPVDPNSLLTADSTHKCNK